MRIVTYHGVLDRCQYFGEWFVRDTPREVDNETVIRNAETPAGRALGFFLHPEKEPEPLKRGPGRPRKIQED